MAMPQGSGTSRGERLRALTPLEHDDARIVAQPLVELAAAHVDGDRRGPRRAASSVSVKPPVEAPTSTATRPRRIEAERVEGAGELEGAAADVLAARR